LIFNFPGQGNTVVDTKNGMRNRLTVNVNRPCQFLWQLSPLGFPSITPSCSDSPSQTISKCTLFKSMLLENNLPAQ